MNWETKAKDPFHSIVRFFHAGIMWFMFDSGEIQHPKQIRRENAAQLAAGKVENSDGISLSPKISQKVKVLFLLRIQDNG